MKSTRLSRRGFLGGTAAAAAMTIVPRHVLGGAGQTPPSEVLTHGVIGVGGMGMGHVGYVKRYEKQKIGKLLAVCDVDAGHLARAVKTGGADCTGYADFQEMLARGDLDVCHVVTPPHWHALMSIAAVEAGCDVWCEKPMTRTIGEAQHVVQAVARNNRMFRINTWFRLNSGMYGMGMVAKDVKKIVAAGDLGWPITAIIAPWTGFNWKLGTWVGKTNLEPQPVPAGFDYDKWLGPAPVKPYHRHRTHGSFRGYWDYDSGGLGDMGQHYLDPVQYLLDKDHTSPVTVEAHAPWPQHPDAAGVWGWVEMTYADGCKIILDSGSWGTPRTKGKPFLEGPKGKIVPARQMSVDERGKFKKRLAELPDPPAMINDFNVSVKTRKKFGLNEVNAARSNLLIHLADVAVRIGRKLRFDPVTRRFIDDDAANKLIDQPMRAPWHL